MTDDDRHAIGHELVRRRHRLIWIAEVVHQHGNKRFAEHAAALVQVIQRHVRTGPGLAAPGHSAGQRRSNADPNLGLSERGSPERRSKSNDQMCEKTLHWLVPPGRQSPQRTYHGSSERRQDRRSADDHLPASRI
jgi:hypothetical protein